MAKSSPYDTEGSKAAKRLADNLKTLPDSWVQCRDMMHAWAILNDFHVAGKINRVSIIKRELVCMRCGCVRFEDYEMTKWGLNKVGQQYNYPAGYQIPGVPRGVKPKAIVQQEQYRRAMEKVANAERGQTEAAEK